MTYSIRSLPMVSAMAIAVGLCYFVIVGGTAIGEVHPAIRGLNGVVGGALIGAYLLRSPGQADWFDRRMLIALLLFAGVAVLSQFPRQSFDALLSALAMVAAIFILRGVLVSDHARNMLLITLRSLSIGLTALIAVMWSGVVTSWLEVTGGAVLPIGISLPPATWGHQYDAALLLLLLLPSWFVRPRSRATTTIGCGLAIVNAILAVLSGSRSVWLAALVATVAVTVVPYVTNPSRRRLILTLGAASVIGVVVIMISPLGPPLMQRVAYTSTLALRVEMWTAVLDVWLGRPFTGLGPGSFPWLLQATDWFDANTAAPIHPDNVIVHALGEGGLLGLSALGVLISVGPRLWAVASAPVRWALATFAIASLGTNPPAFSFFIAVLGVWVAYALPRTNAPRDLPERPWQSALALRAAGLLAAVAAVAFASVTGAHIAHGNARSQAEAARYEEAAAGFSLATVLDPGMGLYRRDLAVDRWLGGDEEAALRDLETAQRLNPSDDLTWRTEAIVRLLRHESKQAVAAINVAKDLQRSDVANMLVAAKAEASDGSAETARDLLAETIQGWPQIVGARGWPELSSSIGGRELIDDAIRRWADGAPTPVEAGYQEAWLLGITGASIDLVKTARPALTREMIAALRCDPTTDAMLDVVGRQDVLWPMYWETRIRAASNSGVRAPEAMIGFTLTSRVAIERQDPRAWLNPWNDGQWAGYRRRPTFWPNTAPLPSPDAGHLRWILLPGEAIVAAGVDELNGSCRRLLGTMPDPVQLTPPSHPLVAFRWLP